MSTTSQQPSEQYLQQAHGSGEPYGSGQQYGGSQRYGGGQPYGSGQQYAGGRSDTSAQYRTGQYLHEAQTAYPYGTAGGYAQPYSPQTNTMAILSLVFAFVFSPLGLVFGFVGWNQIKRTGEQGKGLAIAGLIISGLGLLFFVCYVVLLVMLAAASGPVA